MISEDIDHKDSKKHKIRKSQNHKIMVFRILAFCMSIDCKLDILVF